MHLYERLNDGDLVRGCLLGKTQSVNESLHSVIDVRVAVNTSLDMMEVVYQKIKKKKICHRSPQTEPVLTVVEVKES